MVKDGLLLATICLSWCAFCPANPCQAEPTSPSRIEKLLAVNTALRQGRDYLQRGEYEAAVRVMEARLEWIDANRDYLLTLREAYFGYIRLLQKQGEDVAVQTYLRRLRAIDPGALLELRQPQEPMPKAAGPLAAPPPTGITPLPKAKVKPTPATPSSNPSRVVRGEIEDPFSDKNSREYQEARVLLERAEREFESKQYEAAARFYELAARASPRLMRDSMDRWAYCKMHSVVKQLNDADTIDPKTLKREVRQAMEMSPTKLERFGESLLLKIEARINGEPQSSDVVAAPTGVRHAAEQGGWQVAESEHFRIFHNQTRTTAEQAARIAESTRTKMSQRWFGDAGQGWDKPCDIYLHEDADAYSKATGQSPSCPGHSTMQTEGERVLSRRIDVHCDNANMLPAVLPHETTHVVLAGRFGEKPLPRWADEGMAVLTEPRDRVELHLQNMGRYRREGRLFKMDTLLPMTEYPDAKYVSSFYAQSVSVVEFLTKQKGHRAFTQFLRDGMTRGYEAALQQHYGIRGYEALEQLWLRSVDSGQSVKSNGP